MINNGIESGDFGYKTGIRDLNNVAPRLGFAYNVGGKNDLVIRGGSGIYYNTPVSNATYSHQFYNRSVAARLHPERAGIHGESHARRDRGASFSRGACRCRCKLRLPLRHRLQESLSAGRARSDSRSNWERRWASTST